MMRDQRGRGAIPSVGPLTALALLLAIGSMAACSDDILSVEPPSRVPAEQLEVPANAGLLTISAIGDFECAFGAYVALGALIGDELQDATQTADRFPYDRRDMQGLDRRYAVNQCDNLGVYTPLQVARASSANVLRLLEGWTVEQVPSRSSLIATLSAYNGYALVLLGEGFCTMAISSLDAERQPVYGGEISRDSVFRLALTRFEPALSSTDPSIRNMARVGRARAYLNLGQLDLAKAEAEQVSAGFVRNVTASSTSSRRQNKVWQQSNERGFATSV